MSDKALLLKLKELELEVKTLQDKVAEQAVAIKKLEDRLTRKTKG